MADEREGSGTPGHSPANDDKVQTSGRRRNAAQPMNAAKNAGGPERYPQADRTDAVEPRSFDPSVEAPAPRQGAGDGGEPAARSEGYMGPDGDAAEGKR